MVSCARGVEVLDSAGSGERSGRAFVGGVATLTGAESGGRSVRAGAHGKPQRCSTALAPGHGLGGPWWEGEWCSRVPVQRTGWASGWGTGGHLWCPQTQPPLLATQDTYLGPLSVVLKDRELHPARCRDSGRDRILLAWSGPQSELGALSSKSGRGAQWCWLRGTVWEDLGGRGSGAQGCWVQRTGWASGWTTGGRRGAQRRWLRGTVWEDLGGRGSGAQGCRVQRTGWASGWGTGGHLWCPQTQPPLLATQDTYLGPLSVVLKDRELHPARCRDSGRDRILLAWSGPQSELGALSSKSGRGAQWCWLRGTVWEDPSGRRGGAQRRWV